MKTRTLGCLCCVILLNRSLILSCVSLCCAFVGDCSLNVVSFFADWEGRTIELFMLHGRVCIGMSHTLSQQFLHPLRTTWLSFITAKSFLVNTTVHPSSHKGPNATSDALLRFRSMCPFFAWSDSVGCIGNCPTCSIVIVVPSGCVTSSPLCVVIFDMTSASCGRM